ncbi:MAG: hypothetical protein VXZ82_24875 [Planctomycetota bacterium]|nr:hypothetical protein [Planctomycetota bacterium]
MSMQILVVRESKERLVSAVVGAYGIPIIGTFVSDKHAAKPKQMIAE